MRYTHYFDEKALKACLRTSGFSPDQILFILKKRVEFTADQYPLLTDDNKKAQKTLNPLLREFCSKYGMNMITVPTE